MLHGTYPQRRFSAQHCHLNSVSNRSNILFQHCCPKNRGCKLVKALLHGIIHSVHFSVTQPDTALQYCFDISSSTHNIVPTAKNLCKSSRVTLPSILLVVVAIDISFNEQWFQIGFCQENRGKLKTA